MATIFTKIINGEIPGYKVAETDEFIAFLDINPLKAGHTLVVPKIEVDYIFDQDDALLQDLIVFAKRVAKGIEQAVPAKRVGMSVIGLEVPHTHIHLIPINSIADMTFGTNRPQISAKEMEQIAQDISKHIDLSDLDPNVFTYDDFLALVLIYVANSSEGLSDSEKDHINNEVGGSHFQKAMDYFNAHSEYEVIQKIQELSTHFSKQRDEVLHDVKETIKVSETDQQLEEGIYSILSKIL